MDDDKSFTLSASPTEIMANVETTQITAKLGKKVLAADEFVLYNEKGQVVNIPNLIFSTDTPGNYSFQAYHEGLGVMSNRIIIRVIKNIPFPESPADEQPSNLNFHRIRRPGNCGPTPHRIISDRRC